MGQQEYQAGANMAFKAFGIVDQMQQRQMMQQLQEQQMGQSALKMQLIQAQIRAAQDAAEQRTKTQAWMDKPASTFMQPEMKSVPAPQYQPGMGMPPFAPGAIIQQPTGRNILKIPPNATLGQLNMLKQAEALIQPNKWEPTTREEAIEFEREKAGLKPPTAWKPTTREEAIEFETEKSQLKPETNQYDIIKNAQTGEEQYLVKGSTIPRGWSVVKAPTVKIENMGMPPAASERTAIAETRISMEALNNLKTLFDKSFVGPLAGRAGKVGDVFGFNPQQQSEFNAATAAFKNLIIKQITGAQMSEPEAKRIMKQVPDVNDPPSVWLSKWNQSVRNVETLQQEQLKILEQSGLKVPGGTVERPRFKILRVE